MAIRDIVSNINTIQQAADKVNPLTNNKVQDGFTVPPTYSSDGNGLPFNKVPAFRDSVSRRNIISWFVPEFGLVRMYVNPDNITYTDKKVITPERTKGGYSLQYWGEELTTLNIAGSTGSSGVEGINVLHEIYRAEQFGFDSTGLSLASNNANNNILNNLLGDSGVSSLSNGTVSGLAGSIGSLLGANSPNQGLVAGNINSLAQSAFTVEMYYDGVVRRGYFTGMTVTESASDFLWKYQIQFTVTQTRGYRKNYFPWHRSAKDGPSQYTTPHSFSGYVKNG